MFKYIEPVYQNHMILTAKVLQEHTDYTQSMLQNAYREYSDGIISGVEVEVTDAYLEIGPGLIKHNKVLYCLKDAVKLAYEHGEEQTFLRVRFMDKVEQEGGIYSLAEPVVTKDANQFPYELELGRFTATKGARLYKNISGFSKLAVAYDNFDIRHVKYAAVGESTISPVVTTLFARELMEKNPTDVYDVAFAMQCLNKQPVAKEVILTYLSIKNHQKLTDMTNEQIYKELERILKQQTTQGRMPKRESSIRRLIVD